MNSEPDERRSIVGSKRTFNRRIDVGRGRIHVTSTRVRDVYQRREKERDDDNPRRPKNRANRRRERRGGGRAQIILERLRRRRLARSVDESWSVFFEKNVSFELPRLGSRTIRHRKSLPPGSNRRSPRFDPSLPPQKSSFVSLFLMSNDLTRASKRRTTNPNPAADDRRRSRPNLRRPRDTTPDRAECLQIPPSATDE